MAGTTRAYGILYVEMEDKYGVPATIVSLVGSVFSASFSITGITKITSKLQIGVSAFYASGS